MADDDGWSDDDSQQQTRAPTPPRESRGRGRGGGGGPCYKCQETGHMSRECPNADARNGGGGGSRACFKCNEEGHMSRDCPNAGSGGDSRDRGPMTCRKCNEEGHMARDCPTGGGNACFKCHEEGHMSRDCPNAGSGGDSRDRGPMTCRKCNEEGHMARDCPTGGGNACFKCKEEGHMARDCPNAEANGDDGGRRRGCYNCGEEGHMSKDCTNERREDVDRPPRKDGVEDDPTKERYTPPEMPEGDEIFDERKSQYDTTGINFRVYEDIPFEVSGANKVPSVNTFEELKLRPLILKNLKRCGYDEPTPIQKHGSPQLKAGSHVMCCAQTGSGKTAAFLLPIINQLIENQNDLSPPSTSPARPEALILAPTRELVIQIAKEANMYGNDSMVKTQMVYGGAAIPAQKSRLFRGCNILVATTGRLKQFVKENLVDLSKVQYFILDEADRMLDMGFMPDVDEIVERLPPKEDRVSGMFSATFPPAIQQSAAKYLHDYVFVVIGVVGGACKEVAQEFMEVEKGEKKKKVLEILKEESNNTKVVVFCASKKGADFLATFLSNNNISCTSIHGDRLQSQRETALREFASGKRQVLVATAVAARGLDIPKVGMVINYDLPSEIDEYVHRIGRTGRVGRSGRAISFYDALQDSGLAGSLISILKGAGQPIPDFLSGGGGGGYGGVEEGGFQSTDMRGGGISNGTAAAEEEEEW